MKEYDVKITETLEKTVTVQAESHDAAEEQVRAAYYNSEYILDSENFTGVAFGTTEEREVQKEQADTMNVLLVKPFMYPHVPFPVSWTVKMKKKQKETQDILSYHTQAAGCSDKARAKASGGRQPIEECGRTGL